MSHSNLQNYVTLLGKRSFADKVKLRVLNWCDDPGISRWTLNVITRGLERGRFDFRRSCKVTAEARCSPAGFEDVGRRHGTESAPEAGKGKETYSRLESLEGAPLC